MKRSVCLFLLAVFATGAALGAPEEKMTYYVQLIRGNDEDKPPVPGARPVGSKLSESLHSIFRWKYYWEINQQPATVAPRERVTISLSKERAVEIDLSQPEKRRVTAISGSKAVCTTSEPVRRMMTIIGADRDARSSWFVVVRRDKPSLD